MVVGGAYGLPYDVYFEKLKRFWNEYPRDCYVFRLPRISLSVGEIRTIGCVGGRKFWANKYHVDATIP